MTVPVGGGPPAMLADSLATPESVTWAQDGYLYRTLLTNGADVIARSRPTPGASLEPVTTVDTASGELTHLQPEVLPDGKTLIFQVGYREGKRSIAVADIGSKAHTILFEGIRARYA